MKQFLIGLLILLFSAQLAFSQQTVGGVSWLDSLSYQKPQFYPITEPDESTCPNKYWIDFDSGSGSTCSQANPCASLSSLVGRAGLNGGPAYVYVKGSGAIELSGVTFQGSSGSAVVLKSWPGATSAISLQGGASNYLEGSNINYLIFDGGPLSLFEFRGSSGWGEGNSNGFALNVNGNHITFYRCRFNVNGGTEAVGIARNEGVVTGTKFINCEFYDPASTPDGTVPLLYPGGGNDAFGTRAHSTVNETYIINCIFRNSGAESIEFNPRDHSTGVYIYGSAFHTAGIQSCGTSWACRPAIIIDGPSVGETGGQTTNVHIENNIMWDLGSGGIWTRGGTAAEYIYNNTIYDFGKGAGGGGANPQGISGYTNGGEGTLRNNWIYAPNGTAPLDNSPYTTSDNACGSGKSCGSSSQTVSDSSTYLQSNDETNGNFLKIASTSPARDTGYAGAASTDSYYGDSFDATPDIGADQFGESSGSDTTAPTVTAFTIPSTSNSLAVMISAFTATDDTSVIGYCINESSSAPAASSCSGSGWQASAPPQYIFSTDGSKTLYAWAKDAAGNVSSSLNASTDITLPSIIGRAGRTYLINGASMRHSIFGASWQ